MSRDDGPSEDDLRDMFASSAPGSAPLDAERIIARSRVRRLPRQLAMGAIGTLAVAGIAVVGIQSMMPQPQASTMSQTDAAAPSAEGGQTFDTTTKRAPAEKINLCTGTVAEAAPSLYGLRLDVAFPESAPAGTDPVQGTVRLTNTGTQAVMGTTAASPAITVSQGGIVLWHSNGPMIDLAVTVDLAPGQSMDYPASFSPVRCDVADDEAESFRADLPVLPAGGYNLSAAIDFQPDASMAQQGTPGLDLVTGPLVPITLQ
jgi:hypothetical protein